MRTWKQANPTFTKESCGEGDHQHVDVTYGRTKQADVRLSGIRG